MRIALLNQAFVPDTSSTAQHAADLVAELAREHQVTVVASRRAYNDAGDRFAARENWRGADVRRIACTGYGKSSKIGRVADSLSFLASCAWTLLLLPRQDAVIAMTTPPLISVLGALFTWLKGGRLVLWMMDMNPDQAIVAGWIREDAWTTRLLSRLLRFSLDRADCIVALDRFMKRRILDKGVAPEKVAVLAPWSHDDDARFDAEGRRRFRQRHGLEEKFVVMYSGNHSPCHPLDTLLDAATELRDLRGVVFCFVGGGQEAAKVERVARERKLGNVMRLPYQPREELAASLSSADLHVVVLGDPYRGIVHPCKVYNICTVGAPFLFIGPEESHVSDAIPAELAGRWARMARHGESARVAGHIRDAMRDAVAPGGEPLQRVAERFAARRLTPEMVALVTGRTADSAARAAAAGRG